MQKKNTGKGTKRWVEAGEREEKGMETESRRIPIKQTWRRCILYVYQLPTRNINIKYYQYVLIKNAAMTTESF